MRLDYELTFDDQLALDRARRGAWSRVPGFILLAIFGGLCVGVGVVGYRSGAVEGWWVLPTVFAAVGFGAPFLTRWERRRAWRMANALVPPRIVVTFALEGVLIEGAAERTFLEWRAFSHYRETKELFLLYQGPAFMRWFPKHAFGGDTGVEWFREVLAEKVVRTKYVHEPPAFPVVPAPSNAPAAPPPASS